MERKRLGVVAVVGAVLAATGSVLAGPPSMPAIDLPVDGASVVTAIVAIGVTVLLVWVGPAIGFRLGRSLVRHLENVVEEREERMREARRDEEYRRDYGQG